MEVDGTISHLHRGDSASARLGQLGMNRPGSAHGFQRAGRVGRTGVARRCPPLGHRKRALDYSNEWRGLLTAPGRRFTTLAAVCKSGTR